MIDFLYSIVDSNNLPVLTVFVLGIITSVSPCTFTTNVMVLGFISKDINNKNRVFINGILYTIGRVVSYTILGLICIPILKKGASTYIIQKFISEYGGYILGPTLIVFGLFLLFGEKLTMFKFGFKSTEKSKKLKGGVGAFVLGLLFAMAFCPISAVLYFGMLLPMSTLELGGYLYPAIFAVGSGILVIAIAWIIAYSMSSLSRFYNNVNVFQKYLNIIVGVAFIIFGVYYFVLYFL